MKAQFVKYTALVSLIAILVTILFFTTCVTGPIRGPLAIEFAALIWAEVLFGCSGLSLMGKAKKELPYSLASVSFASLYFIFVLAMALCVMCEMRTSYFVLVHLFGFAVTVIVFMAHELGFGDMQRQAASDKEMQTSKKSISNTMQFILEDARKAFFGNRDLLSKAERLADDFRYAATPDNDCDPCINDLLAGFDLLKDAVIRIDAVAFENGLSNLSAIQRKREMILRR